MPHVIIQRMGFLNDFSFFCSCSGVRLRILISIVMSLMWCCSSEELTIQTRNGPVRADVSYAGKHKVYGFKNIPYAMPPVGSLRFELPMEPETWLSEDDLYTDVVPLCPQYGKFFDLVGQEDCLYLNVYVRKDHELENSSLPVLVHFHGGGFNQGHKDEHVADFLLRFNDIILVTPNYRLGILGFLSFQDSMMPGNLGLWDQHAALNWVSENIDVFGGDRHRITIAGHEAGAASVGFHILAPASHDYFQAAISSTGTAFSSNFLDDDPLPNLAHTVAVLLNCSALSKIEMLLCLKNASLMDIINIQSKSAAFLPVVDRAAVDPFLPLPPKYMYQKGYQKKVNYLVGVTENEASFEVARDFPTVLNYHHLDKMIAHFLKPYFGTASNFDTIVTAAKYHYFRGIEIPTFESIEPQLVKIMEDFLYISPAEKALKLHSVKTDNTFMYVFKYPTGYSCDSKERKCFGDEYYIFNYNHTGGEPDLSEVDTEMVIETLSKIWGNFVKTGQPDTDQKWKTFGEDNHLNYAEISETVHLRVSRDRDDTEFWNTLIVDIKTAQNLSEDWKPPIDSESLAVGTWGVAGLAILCTVLCVALIGLVVITKKRTLTVTIPPVSFSKDVKYSRRLS